MVSCIPPPPPLPPCRVKMSENPVPTINCSDLTTDWIGSLERCFQWSGRQEQKPLGNSASIQAEQKPLGNSVSIQAEQKPAGTTHKKEHKARKAAVGGVAGARREPQVQ